MTMPEWSPGRPFMAALAKEAEAKLHDFTPQNMSNTVMAFARLEYDPGALLPALAAEAHKKLPEFSPQVRSRDTPPCRILHSPAPSRGERFRSIIHPHVTSVL